MPLVFAVGIPTILSFYFTQVAFLSALLIIAIVLFFVFEKTKHLKDKALMRIPYFKRLQINKVNMEMLKVRDSLALRNWYNMFHMREKAEYKDTHEYYTHFNAAKSAHEHYESLIKRLSELKSKDESIEKMKKEGKTMLNQLSKAPSFLLFITLIVLLPLTCFGSIVLLLNIIKSTGLNDTSVAMLLTSLLMPSPLYIFTFNYITFKKSMLTSYKVLYVYSLLLYASAIIFRSYQGALFSDLFVLIISFGSIALIMTLILFYLIRSRVIKEIYIK
ncbi:hypothetical protein [Vibrio harveyi]|uniref:hypothetical protein n=2 Tax=Vibrio harveyi TaxID=669 RepID=UPI000757D63B|nr:hypothetical protein [Vibrio harveyi]PNM43084.1 hypothetical protein AL469_024610 [Vibrio harveyi]